jgi:transketolase
VNPQLSPQGRQLHFGIREHAMGSITNGLCLAGFKAFNGTFLVFSDYLRPALRVAALSKLPSAFVLTHDSVFLGEDGPTHQPVEHAWALRLIPQCEDWRPADGLEVAMMWAWALTHAQGPSTLMLTRQNLPPLKRPEGFEPRDVWRGAYTLEERGVAEGESPTVTLIGTGSEVGLCVEVAQALEVRGVSSRVVSMPSVNLFMRLPSTERVALLPTESLLVSVEAGSTAPWRAIVGLEGVCVGIDSFGASAPMSDLAEHFGFTSEVVLERVLSALQARG